MVKMKVHEIRLAVVGHFSGKDADESMIQQPQC